MGMAAMRRLRAATILLLTPAVIGLAVGCRSMAFQVPDNWRPVEDAASARPVEQPDGGNDRPTVQVLFWYGFIPHTSVRLDVPGERTIFWDPGGRFAVESQGWVRHKDLVMNPAPTNEDIWSYLLPRSPSHTMVVYEFELTRTRVLTLQRNLMDGAAGRQTRGAFPPDYDPLHCCEAVSQFLKQKLADRLKVPRQWFWPADLSDHLLAQNPDRIVVWREDSGVYTYMYESPLRPILP
jgi:hypothetical protein